jgi:hypothetical protein
MPGQQLEQPCVHADAATRPRRSGLGRIFRVVRARARHGVLDFEQKCLRTWSLFQWRPLSAAREPDAHAEGQEPPEVLREDPSRSPVHHEGGAGKAALPIPRRAINWSQDRGRQGPDCGGAATTVESVPRRETNVLRVAVELLAMCYPGLAGGTFLVG